MLFLNVRFVIYQNLLTFCVLITPMFKQMFILTFVFDVTTLPMKPAWKIYKA